MDRMTNLRSLRPERHRTTNRQRMSDAASVAAVMSAAVCVHETASVDTLKSLFLDNRVSAVAVVDPQGTPIGIVTPRDLMMEEPVEAHECELVPDTTDGLRFECTPRAVRDVMMPFAFSVDETTTLTTAAQLMVFEGISHIAVIDRDHRVVGVVSALDVVARVLKTGEIA
jgi:CBS domain-containing protein